MHSTFSRNVLLLFLLLLLLQSCVEISHEININKDKSGKMSIAAGLPKSKILDVISPLIDLPVPDEYENMAKSIVSDLNKMKGISEATYIKDKQNNRIAISCRFRNTADLNKALYKAGGSSKNLFYPSYIKVRKNSFRINDLIPYMRKYYPGEYKTLVENIPRGIVNYTIQVKIPGKITSVSNAAYKISPDRKSASFKCTLDDLVLMKIDSKCKIRFRN